MTLYTALSEYLAHLSERQCSDTHINSVKVRLGRFIAGREAVAVSAVTTADLRAHFDGLAAAGLAVGTLAGYKSSHRSFWRWVVGQGHRPDNPARVLNRREYNYSYRPVNHQPADRTHLQAVVRAIPQFAAHRHYAARDVRDALAVSLAIDSGARRGELWKLRRRDMEQALARPVPVGEGRTVYVAVVVGKTMAVNVRFFDETADLARRWLEKIPGRVWLFCSLRGGERLRRDYMGSAFKRLCDYAGVPVFRYQAVRKRVVMDAIALSRDPKVGQLLAGHSDGRTTAAYYNLLEEEAVVATAAAMATVRRGRPPADGDTLAEALFRPSADDLE